ncbi:hypothetical protein [Leekyejoonella antrihumi]|uniref:MerR family transcriptional regulator n=1 Tax=Leekyejoonella antrihumi TaxID=1660198 RepID=A0A563DW60_9MICO|nr:hypothetical protein [Leekyejoonella antrihumi]TWP34349.1 hypothetical protein FGL98_18135 [Leekyejoonella antrihumi]
MSGIQHRTIADVVPVFGVSTKTIRNYIKQGIIPQPPVVTYGLRDVSVFPDDYIEESKRRLRERRNGTDGDG